ncbi:MAG: hypothetical protein R2795_24310 [Saprospiraceae bacterium]
MERTYEDKQLQNELDAENIYNILETDIISTYLILTKTVFLPAGCLT